ncbi:Periaxin [Dictyocoela muelleri]|nr:Periaxin [Dictyocoela muelleri]
MTNLEIIMMTFNLYFNIRYITSTSIDHTKSEWNRIMIDDAFGFLPTNEESIKNKYVNILEASVKNLMIPYKKKLARQLAMVTYVFDIDRQKKNENLKLQQDLTLIDKKIEHCDNQNCDDNPYHLEGDDSNVLDENNLERLNFNDTEYFDELSKKLSEFINHKYCPFFENPKNYFNLYMTAFLEMMNKKFNKEFTSEEKLKLENSSSIWFSDICYDLEDIEFVARLLSQSDELSLFIILSGTYEKILNNQKVKISDLKLNQYDIYEFLNEDLRSRNPSFAKNILPISLNENFSTLEGETTYFSAQNYSFDSEIETYTRLSMAQTVIDDSINSTSIESQSENLTNDESQPENLTSIIIEPEDENLTSIESQSENLTNDESQLENLTSIIIEPENKKNLEIKCEPYFSSKQNKPKIKKNLVKNLVSKFEEKLIQQVSKTISRIDNEETNDSKNIPNMEEKDITDRFPLIHNNNLIKSSTPILRFKKDNKNGSLQNILPKIESSKDGNKHFNSPFENSLINYNPDGIKKQTENSFCSEKFESDGFTYISNSLVKKSPPPSSVYYKKGEEDSETFNKLPNVSKKLKFSEELKQIFDTTNNKPEKILIDEGIESNRQIIHLPRSILKSSTPISGITSENRIDPERYFKSLRNKTKGCSKTIAFINTEEGIILKEEIIFKIQNDNNTEDKIKVLNSIPDEKENISEGKYDISEERTNKTDEKNDIPEEMTNKTDEKDYISNEMDDISKEMNYISDERDDISKKKVDISEEKDDKINKTLINHNKEISGKRNENILKNLFLKKSNTSRIKMFNSFYDFKGNKNQFIFKETKYLYFPINVCPELKIYFNQLKKVFLTKEEGRYLEENINKLFSLKGQDLEFCSLSEILDIKKSSNALLNHVDQSFEEDKSSEFISTNSDETFKNTNKTNLKLIGSYFSQIESLENRSGVILNFNQIKNTDSMNSVPVVNSGDNDHLNSTRRDNLNSLPINEDNINTQISPIKSPDEDLLQNSRKEEEIIKKDTEETKYNLDKNLKELNSRDFLENNKSNVCIGNNTVDSNSREIIYNHIVLPEIKQDEQIEEKKTEILHINKENTLEGVENINYNSDLEDPALGDPDLRDSDLRDPDLRDSDLRDSDLRDPDLRDPDLRDPDLRDSDLRDPDLRDSDLRDPDLRDSDLGVPDLRVPDLGVPDLGDSDLRVPDLRVPDLGVPDLRVPDLRVPDLRVPDLRDPDLRDSDLRVHDEEMSSIDEEDEIILNDDNEVISIKSSYKSETKKERINKNDNHDVKETNPKINLSKKDKLGTNNKSDQYFDYELNSMEDKESKTYEVPGKQSNNYKPSASNDKNSFYNQKETNSNGNNKTQSKINFWLLIPIGIICLALIVIIVLSVI